MSLVRTERFISFTKKMMSGPLKLKNAMLLSMTHILKTQCSIYSVVQIVRLVKVIQNKALRRENVEEIQLQTKKECFLKLLNISILTQMGIFILQFWGKWWKKNLVVIMFYIWFKQIYFVVPHSCRYSNTDYVATNNWLFQQKIPRPEHFSFILVLVFKL